MYIKFLIACLLMLKLILCCQVDLVMLPVKRTEYVVAGARDQRCARKVTAFFVILSLVFSFSCSFVD